MKRPDDIRGKRTALIRTVGMREAGVIVVAAALAALAGFGWALLAYRRKVASACVVLLLGALAATLPGNPKTVLALAVLCVSLLWSAFATPIGYFWLNRSRLEALVVEINGVPAMTSLDMGGDDPRSSGSAPGRHDSYRFINGQSATHYREQVAPSAPQACLYAPDLLARLHIACAPYQALVVNLERSALAGFDRGANGEIALNQSQPGGTPWGTSFVYRPAGGAPDGNGSLEQRQLAPRWFYVVRG